MKKGLMVFIVLVLMALPTFAVFADNNPKVEYTWSIADLGQGVWGGGPLYSDGTGGGNVAFSAVNGQLVFQLQITGWSAVVPGQLLEACFVVRAIKGTPPFPSPFCATLPVTGGPVNVGGFIMRVTPVN